MEAKDMKELQELREQFNLINEKLEKQAIINETLIKESMKENLSYIDKTFKLYVYAGVFVTPILIALLILNNAPLVLWLFIAIALILEQVLYRKEYRKLDTKSLVNLGHVEAVERVATFNKNFKKIGYVMFVPAICLCILFIGLVTDFKFDMGSVIYYLICIIIALSYEYFRKRKMFKKLDSVLKQIKELRGE